MDEARLKSIPVFAGLGDDALHHIAALASEVSVPAGKQLVREGDYSYEMLAIEEGTATVEQGGTKVADVGPGDVIGEMGVIGRVPDPLDARRASYRLERAGQALFPHVMVLARWGGSRCQRQDSLTWVHVGCGQQTQGRMACSHCLQALLPRDVERPAAA